MLSKAICRPEVYVGPTYKLRYLRIEDRYTYRPVALDLVPLLLTTQTEPLCGVLLGWHGLSMHKERHDLGWNHHWRELGNPLIDRRILDCNPNQPQQWQEFQSNELLEEVESILGFQWQTEDLEDCNLEPPSRMPLSVMKIRRRRWMSSRSIRRGRCCGRKVVERQRLHSSFNW